MFIYLGSHFRSGPVLSLAASSLSATARHLIRQEITIVATFPYTIFLHLLYGRDTLDSGHMKTPNNMLPQLNAVLTQLWDNKSTMLVIGYFLLVHLLRYRRLNQTIKKYNYKTREDYASMTLQEAHSIQLALGEFEFPSVFSKAIFFAIFKVTSSR